MVSQFPYNLCVSTIYYYLLFVYLLTMEDLHIKYKPLVKIHFKHLCFPKNLKLILLSRLVQILISINSTVNKEEGPNFQWKFIWTTAVWTIGRLNFGRLNFWSFELLDVWTFVHWNIWWMTSYPVVQINTLSC